MLDRGADNYNETMKTAARRGHLNIVELMLDRGANNYNEVLSVEASQGHQ